jgi:hypothetical protein
MSDRMKYRVKCLVCTFKGYRSEASLAERKPCGRCGGPVGPKLKQKGGGGKR